MKRPQINNLPNGRSAGGVDRLIITIRGQRVILDADLAAFYGVSAKRLNEQVKRNEERFPGILPSSLR
jgi:hypothetical protein